MTVVAEILKSKPDTTVHTVRPEDSVLDALRLMAEKGIGALLVTQDADRIVGIFTERDYARKIALLGRTSAATQVRDVMTPDVLYVRLHQTSEQCMQLMSTNRLRHLWMLQATARELQLELVSPAGDQGFQLGQHGFLPEIAQEELHTLDRLHRQDVQADDGPMDAAAFSAGQLVAGGNALDEGRLVHRRAGRGALAAAIHRQAEDRRATLAKA